MGGDRVLLGLPFDTRSEHPDSAKKQSAGGSTAEERLGAVRWVQSRNPRRVLMRKPDSRTASGERENTAAQTSET